MDLLKIGAQLFMSKIGASGGDLDLTKVISSLGALLPQNESGDLDIAGLVSKMQGGGLASLATSFLSDGPNEGFSIDQITGLLGDSKINSFASSLNIPKDTALSGLTSMIPDLVDKQSEGGSLLGSIGGSVAKNMLGKLF